MNSIRHNLTRSLLVALVLLLLLGGLATYFAVRTFLVSQFDAALVGKGRALAALVELEDGRIRVELSEMTDERLADFERSDDPDCFQVWTVGGEMLQRSRSLQGQDLPRPTLSGHGEQIFELRLPDGRSARAVAIRSRPHVSDDQPATASPSPLDQVDAELVLARSRDRLDDALRACIQGLVALEGFLLAVVLYLVRSRVRAGLAPLLRLASEVGQIDETSLDRRLPTEGLPEELEGISEKLNALLVRLQSAFDRERRFASSAAHELRTPITEMRTLLEVSLESPRSQSLEERIRDLRELHTVTVEMSKLVEMLLSMTRKSGDRSRREIVALDRAIAAAVATQDAAARAKGLAVSLAVPAELGVRVDPDAFTVILHNLIGNAVDHSPSFGGIEISARRHGTAVELILTNEAPDIRPEDLPRLFEPFWRRDESRTGSRHRGLGLAIVETLAREMGLRIEARLESPGRITFALAIEGAESIPVEPVAFSP